MEALTSETPKQSVSDPLIQRVLADLLIGRKPIQAHLWDLRFFRIRADAALLTPIHSSHSQELTLEELALAIQKYNHVQQSNILLTDPLETPPDQSVKTKTVQIVEKSDRVNASKLPPLTIINDGEKLQAMTDAMKVLENADSPMNYIGRSIYDSETPIADIQRYVVYLQKQLATCSEIVAQKQVKGVRTLIETLKTEQVAEKEKRASYRGVSEEGKTKLKKYITKGLPAEHQRLLKMVINMDIDVPNYQQMTLKQLKAAIARTIAGVKS